MSKKINVIAIDGPSGAGKSTVAKRTATRLGYRYLDTGAMYRSVGLKADREGISFDDDAALEELCARTKIDFSVGDGSEVKVLLDGEDVSEMIREHRVSGLASRVSARKPVRDAMAGFQREIGATHPTVAEGRDMGTVVFPDAKVKVFLTADARKRAERRTLELRSRGQQADFDKILADIEERDTNDSARQHSPLKPAEDAVHVDTSEMTVDEVVAKIVSLA